MDLVPRKALAVSSQMLINQVLGKMIESGVSCVLVHDANENIVGIMTERDVIRKLSLLKADISLDRPINTVMARPVAFVDQKNLLRDIAKLHRDKRLRHFPVLKDVTAGAKVSNLAGILTVTDVARAYLNSVAK